MSSKWNYIMGAATITLIVGGTVYAIKKSYDKKKQEEEAITAEEAQAIVREKRSLEEEMTEQIEETIEKADEIRRAMPINMDALRDDVRDTAGFNASFNAVSPTKVVSVEEIEEHIEEEIAATEEGYGFYDDVDFDRPWREYMNEEDKELKHEPNSIEARQQYLKMELADWTPMSDPYQTLLRLYEFDFEPQNDGDEMLATKIVDYRVQFFGFGSRWSKEVNYADIVLYFARMADYNCGNGVPYWVDYILDHSGLSHLKSSAQLGDIIEQLNAHTYFNEQMGTFGLFGLGEQSMESAINIANNNIDKSVTYEIEFNELLKSCL